MPRTLARRLKGGRRARKRMTQRKRVKKSRRANKRRSRVRHAKTSKSVRRVRNRRSRRRFGGEYDSDEDDDGMGNDEWNVHPDSDAIKHLRGELKDARQEELTRHQEKAIKAFRERLANEIKESDNQRPRTSL